MCRCGTLGYGLVGMVVLGGWLDSILEVFSNLRFYDFKMHIQAVVTWLTFSDWRDLNSLFLRPSHSF